MAQRKRLKADDEEQPDGPGEVERWEAALIIDEDALEAELKHQPDSFYKVGRALAEAISIRDAAKQDVAETEAEFALEFRRTAKDAGDKITEKEVEAETTMDKGVIAARGRFNAAQRQVNILTVLKEAYKDRGYALGRLVDLHLEGYYGSDQATRGSDNRMKNSRAAQAKADNAERYRRERGEHRRDG